MVGDLLVHSILCFKTVDARCRVGTAHHKNLCLGGQCPLYI